MRLICLRCSSPFTSLCRCYRFVCGDVRILKNGTGRKADRRNLRSLVNLVDWDGQDLECTPGGCEDAEVDENEDSGRRRDVFKECLGTAGKVATNAR